MTKHPHPTSLPEPNELVQRLDLLEDVKVTGPDQDGLVWVDWTEGDYTGSLNLGPGDSPAAKTAMSWRRAQKG
jgi:hypothetical protein